MLIVVRLEPQCVSLILINFFIWKRFNLIKVLFCFEILNSLFSLIALPAEWCILRLHKFFFFNLLLWFWISQSASLWFYYGAKHSQKFQLKWFTHPMLVHMWRQKTQRESRKEQKAPKKKKDARAISARHNSRLLARRTESVKWYLAVGQRCAWTFII